MFVATRDDVQTGDTELDAIAQKLSMDNLLCILKSADNMETAAALSDSLKEIWKAHLDSDLRWKLDTAIYHLLGGDTTKALSCFSELCDEDPHYAEAWNKASTCEFMIGNLDASMVAARKTLEVRTRLLYRFENYKSFCTHWNAFLGTTSVCQHIFKLKTVWDWCTTKRKICRRQ